MYIARFIVLFEHSMLHMDKYFFPAFFFILLVYYSLISAGWSSLEARRAHNPKVVGSNPAPAILYVYS